MTDPVLTADAVVLAGWPEPTHVLLIQRGWPPFQNMWALPGGELNKGEDPEIAAWRELDEETRLNPQLVRHHGIRHIGVYDQPGRDPRGDYHTYAYVVTLADMVEPAAADDAQAAGWFPLKLARKMRLAFDHNLILEDALRDAHTR